MDWNTYYSMMGNYSNIGNSYNNWNYQAPQFNWANNYPMNFQMPSVFFQGLTPQKTTNTITEAQPPVQDKKEEKVIDDGKKYFAISKKTGNFYKEQELYNVSPENIEKYKKEYNSKSKQRSAIGYGILVTGTALLGIFGPKIAKLFNAKPKSFIGLMAEDKGFGHMMGGTAGALLGAAVSYPIMNSTGFKDDLIDRYLKADKKQAA